MNNPQNILHNLLKNYKVSNTVLIMHIISIFINFHQNNINLKKTIYFFIKIKTKTLCFLRTI